MNGSHRSLSYILLLLLLAFPLACSDDDGNGGTNPGNIDTGDPVTEATIEQGLQMSDTLVELMPQWSSGNLVGPPAKEANYIPSCQCWYWDVTQGDGFANPFDYTMWSFWATFFSGETIVQNPQEADRVQVQVSYIWNKGFYPEGEQGGDNESTSFSSSIILSLSPVGGDVLTVSGSGTAEYLSVGEKNGSFFEHYGSFDVSMNLSLPLGDCPSGTMTIEEGQTLFSISYDGSSTANWTLSRGDQGNPVQGTRALGCGTPN